MKRIKKNNKEFLKEIQKNKCFLCEPSGLLTIFEDGDFVVVLDQNPSVEGHLICAPKEHVERLSELDEEKAKRLMLLIRKFDASLRKIFRPFRVAIVSSGLAVKHLHFHIIPVPNEEMMWDFKYLRKDEIIEHSKEETADLVKKIKEASE